MIAVAPRSASVALSRPEPAPTSRTNFPSIGPCVRS